MVRVGRPTEMNNRRRGHPVSFYMDDDMMQVLDDISNRERESISGIVRKAVQEYLKTHAEGNPCYELDKWQEDPNFKAIPTLLSDPLKWSDYLKQCNKEELTEIAIITNHIMKRIQLLWREGR